MEHEGSLPSLPVRYPEPVHAPQVISSTIMLHLKGMGHVAHLSVFIYGGRMKAFVWY
jgi:hypothetical protein